MQAKHRKGLLSGKDSSGQPATEREDFPYRVELWDDAGRVERVVAVAATSGLGHAALNAAAQDCANRTPMLRRQGDPQPVKADRSPTRSVPADRSRHLETQTQPPLLEPEGLSYHVELWRRDTDSPERTLALASYASLAHALFRAATAEHPERRITLRRGNRTLADTMYMR